MSGPRGAGAQGGPEAPAGRDNYRIAETIHATGRAHIHRGFRAIDGKPFILKVLTLEASAQHRERLDNELAIAASLTAVPGAVIQVVARESITGQPALVLEDFGGHALRHFITGSLPVGRFLDIAIRTTAAVADVHAHDVVHRDLKPDNIVVHPDTGEVRLTDFGLATTLPDPRPSRRGLRLLEGSLPYMSPEQTGRSNRVVDQRSDLYSLGITFFEMLSGKLPFTARDPVEWVHCHVARTAPAVTSIVPSVPAAVANIVARLLAKDPDERYQSARGLLHDLERCQAAWQAGGAIEPFPIGSRDRADRFQIPERLYGRMSALGALSAAFTRVVDGGQPELTLVTGYSGIGKSALVNGLMPLVVQAHGIFAAGKFDQYKRDIPYATVVEACTRLVLDILAEGDEHIAHYRTALQAALGANGQIIVDVIPQVELVIGPQPPVPVLPPAESQNRFRLLFRSFIAVFASAAHPLVLFLDDLQWADAASLALMSDLSVQQDCHLFLVGAYRDNEVGASHPLSVALAAVRKAGARVREVVLEPLGEADLTQLVADTLNCPLERAAPLARLIGDKTGGNPFFTIQFLSALHDERLIERDDDGVWHWNTDKIRARGFTDNVVDLMVEKLRRLDPAGRHALERLACLGSQTEANTLDLVLESSASEGIQAVLGAAARAGLVVRLDDSYRFSHDRVQEAAYSFIPPATRPAVHLQIGRLLLRELSPDEIDERVFDVVSQLNRGVELIRDASERQAVFRLNQLAGRRAKAGIAYAAARTHFAQAVALLPEGPFTDRYEEAFNLHLELAECEYLLADHGAAEARFVLLDGAARSAADHTRVTILRMRLYQTAGRYDVANELALAAFTRLGIEIPRDPDQARAAFAAEVALFTQNRAGRRFADLIDAPVITDPDVRAALALFVDFLPCAFNTGSPTLPFMIARALNLCLVHGSSPEACFAYSAGAMVMVTLLGDASTAHELSQLALALEQRHGDGKLRGTVLFLHGGFVNFWHQPFSASQAIFDRALAASLEVGDFVYAGYNGSHAVWHSFERGEALAEVTELSQRYATIFRQIHTEIMAVMVRQYDQFIAGLEGRTRVPGSFDGDGFTEVECLAAFKQAGALAGFFIHHLLKSVTHFIYEQTDEAVAATEAADALVMANLGTALEAAHHFYHGLILAAAHDAAPPERQAAFRDSLRAACEKHARWAQHCPANFGHRHRLLEAELARLEGRDLEAMRGYEAAIDLAAASSLLPAEAIANEVAARFYRARGFARSADGYLRAAAASYARWGARGKTKQLEARFPELRRRAPLSETSTFTFGTQQIDLLSVIKASQAISGEIVLDQLLTKLVEVVIAHAGAERGYVLLARDGQLSIEAEALVEAEGKLAVQLLRSLSITGSTLLPISIVKYVARANEEVLLDNASASKFASDPYVQRRQPKSILCLPILRQGALAGVLYLENNLYAGAFGHEQIELIELLASQAAISLEHAVLLAKEKAARVQATEALRLRDEFLTVASHELRTPMTSLTLTLQTLQGQASPSGQRPVSGSVAGAIDLATRQALRMNRLITELLEVSRIQSSRFVLERIETDLVALTREAIRRFASDLERAGCTVSLHGVERATGNWDRSRLDRVVENLLANAIKFGRGRPIEIGFERGDRMVQMTVRDHGIGIDPSQHAVIFERFGRAVSEEHYGGLGLGLYICQRIVVAHGGTIEVASQPGAGATFTVGLPIG